MTWTCSVLVRVYLFNHPLRPLAKIFKTKLSEEFLTKFGDLKFLKTGFFSIFSIKHLFTRSLNYHFDLFKKQEDFSEPLADYKKIVWKDLWKTSRLKREKCIMQEIKKTDIDTGKGLHEFYQKRNLLKKADLFENVFDLCFIELGSSSLYFVFLTGENCTSCVVLVFLRQHIQHNTSLQHGLHLWD